MTTLVHRLGSIAAANDGRRARTILPSFSRRGAHFPQRKTAAPSMMLLVSGAAAFHVKRRAEGRPFGDWSIGTPRRRREKRAPFAQGAPNDRRSRPKAAPLRTSSLAELLPRSQSSISSRCQNGDEGKEQMIREADRLPKERETSSAIGRRRSKTQKTAKSGSHPKRNGGIASFPAD